MKIKNNSGFSVIELMIVIAILGLAASIAVPNLTTYLHNTNLKTAGRDLAGDIYNAKQNAAAQAVHYKIIINKTNNNYRILKGGSNSTDSYDEATAIIKNLNSIASYITIDSTTYQSDEICIQPRGTTSPGGSVTLKNDKSKQIIIKTSLMGKVSVEFKDIL